MSTSEPELSPDVENAKGLRTGWTTGTCASAAAKAATLGLISGAVPSSVEVALPNGQRVTFPTVDAKLGPSASAAICKDAGDDPDCTDGAHITATVRWADGNEPSPLDEHRATRRTPTVTLEGGDGVGTVTLPGLGLEVGSPAINPVPRAMITAAIAEVTTRDVVCTITVPRGQEMAKKTSNERLGIVGGISILGTTGIVKPFSTASYRASVVQQVEVAAAQGQQRIVLCTGSRSDMWAQNHFDDLEQVCFVEVGDFTGIALRKAWSHEMPHLVFVGMAGKIAKLAAGVMMTHFHRSKVDIELLKSVAVESEASDVIVAAATETNTARHFAETCMASDEVEPLRRLCVRAAKNCRSHIGADSEDFDADSVIVEVIMVDFAGTSEVCRGR